MAPASGPVENPKLVPAATMDDQEAIQEGSMEPTYLGPVPFSSPDPATDGRRMLPLEDGTSATALSAREDAKAASAGEDYSSKSPDELKALAEERDLEIKGTGKGGNVLKSDLVGALQEDDASDMKASDFKERIEAAQTQEELDAAAEFYAASGKEYKSVAAAVEKRQDEINEQSS